MEFLRGIVASGVHGVLRAVAPGGAGDCLDVVDIPVLSQYLSSHHLELVSQNKCLHLYRCVQWRERHEIVLYNMNLSTHAAHEAFSLRRFSSPAAATHYLEVVSRVLLPICETSNYIFSKDKLQEFSSLFDPHQFVTTAHVACSLGLEECLAHPDVWPQLSQPVGDALEFPIHTSIRCRRFGCFKTLLGRGLPLQTQRDKRGHTALHLAARTDPAMVEDLCRHSVELLDVQNNEGETGVVVACRHNNNPCLSKLVDYGASLDIATSSGLYPVHVAVQSGSRDCVSSLCLVSSEQVNKRDATQGLTPLHHASTKETTLLLLDLGADTNATSAAGRTPLHVKVEERNMECVMPLLCHLASVDAADAGGNTVLHTATTLDDPLLVKCVIVFGADVDVLNHAGLSPRHLAATGYHHKSLEVLVQAGSSRCSPGTPGCDVMCAGGGAGAREPPLPPSNIIPQCKAAVRMYDEVVREAAVSKALASASETRGVAALLSGMRDVPEAEPEPAPLNLLALDGGGIRGLILIQMLLFLEQRLGHPVISHMQWIAGTSTGGILALALARGNTMRQCQALYFRLKEKVFVGSRPYSSEPLEYFLQQEFGKETKMSDLTGPKVLVTGVLADRDPAILHLFRNYRLPEAPVDTSYNQHPHEPWFRAPRSPDEQVVWRAARASGAAPTYFNAWGRFVDGGLIANNPTLDLLTEVEEYHQALRSVGHQHACRPVGLVLSLGTGKVPVRHVHTVDLCAPNNIWSVAKSVFGAKELGSLLVEQATSADGRCVDRARAWCSCMKVPYFRLSPQLERDVRLDEAEDAVLVDMCFQTHVYLQQQRDTVQHLLTLLTH